MSRILTTNTSAKTKRQMRRDGFKPVMSIFGGDGKSPAIHELRTKMSDKFDTRHERTVYVRRTYDVPRNLEVVWARKRSKAELAHVAAVLKYVLPGDIITSQQCGGGIREHVFTGFDGKWLCGKPTRTTFAIEGMEGRRNWDENCADDISPRNVLYINHCSVAALSYLAPSWSESIRANLKKARV